MLGLYAGALILRLYLLPSGLYGDEGWHYHVSRTWGAPVRNVHVLDFEDVQDGRALFLWRLGFAIPLTPAALISFEAYRALFSTYVSLLAPLVFVILRELFVRRSIAIAAGGVVAVSPFFVTWGERVFPDALMATFLLCALWFWIRHAIPWAAAFCLLGLWCKEAAIVFVGPLLLLQLLRDHQEGRLRLMPLHIARDTLLLIAICPIGLIPLFYALQSGVAFPGWTDGQLRRHDIDLLFGSSWLIPFVLLGLAWSRTRAVSFLALVQPAFYLLHNIVRGRNIEAWYHVLPQLLALIASLFALDEAARRGFSARPFARSAPKVAAAAIIAVFLLGAILPAGVDAKRVLSPASFETTASLPETFRFELARDRTLDDVLSHVDDADRDAIFILDVGWFFTWYPFGTFANVTRRAYSEWLTADDRELPRWTNTAENLTQITILYKLDLPFSLAFRDTYRDCIEYENADYVILRPPACAGRGDVLATNYHARRAAPT